MRVAVRALLLAASTLAASNGHADPLAPEPLVLRRGVVGVDLSAESFLGPRRLFGRPTSVAYDLWWGVTSRVTLGVIHSSRSLDRIDAGAGICVHDAEACQRTYGNAGLDVRWRWSRTTSPSALAVAPRIRFLVRDVDPYKPAVTLGALARWSPGALVITADPYLRLGLANRDRGNRAALVLPCWIGTSPKRRVAIALHTGLDGDVATWRDGWHVPVGLVLGGRLTTTVTAAFEIGFSSLLGPQNDHKHRTAMVTVGWRSGA